MCGISGFCDFTKESNKQTLEAMTAALHHRGPDDEGHRFIKSKLATIGLGHKRLSVLDLSNNGHQPMTYKGMEVIYNGEIYNYKEIRAELIVHGYSFVSDTDTEVLLKAFHKWGVGSIEKMNGMFAFVIYDKENNKLFMVRDRVGVKPLYYHKKEGLILFSSELKSFHHHSSFNKKLCNSGLSLYFQYGYIPEPYSIYKDTFKVKAGHYIELELLSGTLTEHQYWNVLDFYTMPKLDISLEDAEKIVEPLLISSCEYRMVSDIPVGIFLSGGYDSSLVTAILKDHKNSLETFTIGFNDKNLNESEYAKIVSEFCEIPNNVGKLSPLDVVKMTKMMSNIYDEPFGDGSALPTIFLSRLAKEKVGVALSADGGDEVFAGYEKYEWIMLFYKKFNRVPRYIRYSIAFILNIINPKYIPLFNSSYNFSTRYQKIINILKSRDASDALKHISVYNTDREVKSLIGVKFTNTKTNFDISTDKISDNLDKILFTDYKTYLTDDILVKVDRATMSASLEGRDPLLDHRIIELMARLPSKYKLRKGETKILLKRVTHAHIPKKLMDRPKKGFGAPMETLLKDDLKLLLLHYLDEGRIDREGILNYQEVARLRDSFLSNKQESAHKLWLILVFEMWYEKWME
jgi:asparagine synthase (glutamine-hydrolysing)